MFVPFFAMVPLAVLSAGESVTRPAVEAVNALGVELLQKVVSPESNSSLSPYSIQTALVMTFAGAEGETREQMAQVLHFPESGAVGAFAALQKEIDAMTARTEELAEKAKKSGGPSDPIALTVANRLFGQTGYEFRPAYLALLKNELGAPFEELNFLKAPDKARKHINAWVEKQTRDRIKDLLPDGSISRETGLVLVNALYLKAPWASEFEKSATAPQPFVLADGKKVDVATMQKVADYGFEKRDGYCAVAIPYVGGDLQLVILLPDAADGLASLRKKMTPAILAGCAALPTRDVKLFLPKFKLEPPLFELGETLRDMGMKSAFDVPPGSADFDGIAPRKPDDYLYISEIFHKTFVEIDEQGTEAAAATAVVMFRAMSMPAPTPEPLEVRVDRPFLFAIQHRPTGACLFLGQVTDPR